MQRLFSSFPIGSAGAALLVLRLCAAASLVTSALCHFKTSGSISLLIAALGIGAFICLGAMLPFCCALAVALQIAFAFTSDSKASINGVIDALQTTALAFLGAGAYSIDARLYGRRVVILPRKRGQ